MKIISCYQPLYSVREKKYIGVEALSRGLKDRQMLNAEALFNLPKNFKESLDLNKMCIRQALSSSKNQLPYDQLAIFLNLDSALMDHAGGLENDLLSIINELKIDPDKIVIELIENRVKNFHVLLNFVRKCREYGFLIALDDVGSGYSNLERLVQIKPDIIKIDRNLVKGVSDEFHKKEVCRSLIELSHSIGALSLTEGVESVEDALECQNLGTDILQGYYFSEPKETFNQIDISSPKVSILVETWKFLAQEKTREIKNNIYIIKKQALNICSRLLQEEEIVWDSILNTELKNLFNIECAYILDSEGTQISKTILKDKLKIKKHFLFSPAKIGTDHSQKHYFLRRADNQKWYISDMYISRATGNICRTVSLMFEDSLNKKFYLCLDIQS